MILNLASENKDRKFGLSEQIKGINYWALANMANYNKASLPEELRELSLNVRHTYVHSFEAPDVEKEIWQPDTDLRHAIAYCRS